MNHSFSFSLHENSPSWLEPYYQQINDSAAIKRRLERERKKHPLNKVGDTSILQNEYDNSLYTTFFSGEKVHHIHLVHRAAIRHWRNKEIGASELAGPGAAEEINYEIDQETDNQEQTVPEMKLFDQSLLASKVRARAALARIINADHSQFAKLAQDISCDVRLSVLENQKCPNDVIELLCRDTNPQIAKAARQRLGYL